MRARHTHILKPVTRVSMPHRLILVGADIGIDQASRPTDQTIRYVLGRTCITLGVLKKQHTYTFNEWGTDIHWLDAVVSMTSGGQTAWLIVDGLRRWLDAANVWASISDATFDYGGICVLQSSPGILKLRCRRTGGTVVMLDRRNWGVPSRWRRGCADEQVAKLRLWCEWYSHMLAEHDMGSWAMTAAAQGWHSYRRRHMTAQILVHCDDGALVAERAAYYGGRCECRLIGHAGHRWPGVDDHLDQWRSAAAVYHVDVNAMYVHVATNLYVPTRLIGHLRQHEIPIGNVGDRRYGMVAEVTVQCDQPIYPLRMPDARGKVIDTCWPVGKYRTWLCGPELEQAQVRGHVLHWHDAYLYHCEPALRSWCDAMWSMHGRYDRSTYPMERATVKAITLGLFGRFGAHSHQWTQIPDHDARAAWDWWRYYDRQRGTIHERRTIDSVSEQYDGGGEGMQSCPAIAAWINAAGRMYLWRLMELAGQRNVMYYDTDSLWVDGVGWHNLCSAGCHDEVSLGSLKLVAVHRHVEWRGIKSYIADGVVTCAGLPRRDPDDVTPTAVVDESIPMASELARRRPPRPISIRASKAGRTPYRHGVVAADGTVTPHVIW